MKKFLIINAKALSVLLIFVLAVFTAFSISPIYKFEKPAPFSGPDIFNPYEDVDWETGWKRANFHTHTKVDGIFNECPEYPDTVYVDYMRLGYDVVTFSNHNEITEHPYDPALQVDVYEHGYNLFKFHKLVFGPERGVNHFDHILPLFASQKQWQYDMLSRHADFIQMNHPDRTNHTTKRSMELLTGYRIMEGDSGKNTEFAHWDEALSAGHYSFGIANDDCHDSRASRRVAVRCSFLNTPSAAYDDLRETLLSGRFYAMRVPDYGNGDWDVKYAENRDLPTVEGIGLQQDTVYLKLSESAALIKAIGQDHVTLDSLANTDTFAYVMRAEDPYVRMTAYFDDGAVIYTNPFARYDKSEADSPYRENPHPVNIPLTVLFNLAVAGLLLGWCALIRLILRKRRQ